MSATRKKNTKNLRLRRKLTGIVSAQHKIDFLLGNTLLDMKRLVKIIDKIKSDHPK